MCGPNKVYVLSTRLITLNRIKGHVYQEKDDSLLLLYITPNNNKLHESWRVSLFPSEVPVSRNTVGTLYSIHSRTRQSFLVRLVEEVILLVSSF